MSDNLHVPTNATSLQFTSYKTLQNLTSATVEPWKHHRQLAKPQIRDILNIMCVTVRDRTFDRSIDHGLTDSLLMFSTWRTTLRSRHAQKAVRR